MKAHTHPRRFAGIESMIGASLRLDGPFTTDEARGRLMTRALGATYLIGPLVGVAVLALEQPDGLSWWGVLAAAAFSLGFATLLLSGRADGMTRGALDVVMGATVAALSVGVYYSGRPGSGITFFYLWAVPLAFYFLPLAHALGQAAFASACFAVVTAVQIVFNPTFGQPLFAVGRWLMVTFTIVVMGVLVYRLSASLRESTRLVERGFTESLAGVALIGLDGRCIAANDAMARMVGRPAEQLVGTTMEEVSHPDDLPALEATLQAASTGEPRSNPGRRRYVWPDGRVVWAERTFSLVRDERGEPLFLFVQAMDVTDRVNAEESMAQSERRFRAIFDNVPLGLTFAGPDGTMLEANRAAESMIGHRAADLRGTTSRAFIFKDDLATFDKEVSRLTHAQGEKARIEARIVRGDGELRDAVITVAGVFDSSHNMIGRIAIAEDVTDRKKAEAEAVEARQMMSTILASASVLVFALDPAGRLTRVEGNLLQRRGFGDPEARRRLEAVLAPAARAALEASGASEPAMRSTLIEVGEVQLESVTVPVFGPDGTARGAVGVAVDVTERRRAEVAERESQAKSQFLANMSHELRNPVNVVLGFAQLLERESPGPLNERQRHYVEVIQHGGRQMLDLLNDLLDLSKIVAGKMEVAVEPVDVGAVITTCIDEMSAFAASRRVALRRSGAASLFASADRRRLMQVVLNMLSNAIKFTGEGGSAEVELRADGDSVRVTVRDTGIGIAAADLDRIFDEFTQLMPAPGQEGTGLGLPLSKRLAELMGGRISVVSKLGGGSAFTLTLRPYAEETNANAAAIGSPVA